MRSYVPAYELETATSLKDVTRRLASEPGAWTLMAGGTDLMVLFESGDLKARRLLGLWRLGELRGIHAGPSHVVLGALTTYSEVRRDPLLAREFPTLGRAAAETGGLAIQNRGTLGGNIANASPAADTPPALLALDAELKLVSAAGERWVPYATFHTGYKQTILQRGELIAQIRLPRRPTPQRHYYRKAGTRLAQAISKVVLAGRAEVRAGALGEVRLAIGSVGPVTIRCVKTEVKLTGRPLTGETIDEAAETLQSEIAPIDDIRSTAEFRRAVAGHLLRQFVNDIRLERP